MKKGIKDALAPQGLFEDLGLKYVGPVDGHDRAAMEQALAQAKRFNGPVIVHALTRKGFGYDAAERHEADQFHSPGPFDVETGAENPKGRIWTDVFADEIVAIGAAAPRRRRDHRRDDAPGRARQVPGPVPRAHLRRRHRRAARRDLRGRARDGRAAPGGRGLRDVPQPGLRPGADGRRAAPLRRHLRARPGRRHRRRRRQPQRHVGHVGPPGRARAAAGRAPRRGPAARAAQRGGRGRRRPDGRAVPEGPAARRHPGGRQGRRLSTCWSATAPRTCWSSPSARWRTVAVDVAERLSPRASASRSSTRAGSSRSTRRWSTLARDHRLVVSVEDNGAIGGCGAVLLQTLNAAGVTTPVRLHGIPQEFLDHAKRGVDPRADRPRRPDHRPRHRRRSRAPSRGVARRPRPEASMSTTRAEAHPPLFRLHMAGGAPRSSSCCRWSGARTPPRGSGPDDPDAPGRRRDTDPARPRRRVQRDARPSAPRASSPRDRARVLDRHRAPATEGSSRRSGATTTTWPACRCMLLPTTWTGPAWSRAGDQ